MGKHHPWIIVTSGFDLSAGQSRANYYLARYLLKEGYPVHLIGHTIAPDLQMAGEATFHIITRTSRSELLGTTKVYRQSYSIIQKLVDEKPTTRVIVNGGNCPWMDINWVHYVHSAFRPSLDLAPRIYRLKEQISRWVFCRRERKCIPKAKKIITNSEKTRQDLIRYLQCDPSRTQTVYLGAENDWTIPDENEREEARQALGYKDNRPLVVFVGGLGYDGRKGFDSLWNAWSLLCSNREWEGDLIVLGGGPSLSYWQHKTDTSAMYNRIRFLGATSKVRAILAGMDLLVSPVRYEPYGLNVQEAICRGLPAIVSRAAGVAERYSAEYTPLLIDDANNSQELANRIQNWYSHQQEWRTRFVGFSERIRGYSWDQMAEKMVEQIHLS